MLSHVHIVLNDARRYQWFVIEVHPCLSIFVYVDRLSLISINFDHRVCRPVAACDGLWPFHISTGPNPTSVPSLKSLRRELAWSLGRLAPSILIDVFDVNWFPLISIVCCQPLSNFNDFRSCWLIVFDFHSDVINTHGLLIDCHWFSSRFNNVISVNLHKCLATFILF